MTPTSPIVELTPAEQQHLLFLFLPVKKGPAEHVNEAVTHLKNAFVLKSAAGNDRRAATGVHFFLFYLLGHGQNAGLPIPSFQAKEDRGLLVVQAIYDADFAPYIGSFVEDDDIAKGLNTILFLMDETGIIDPSDPTSAAFILENGGVQSNVSAFNCLLMRYNFADPTIPAATPALGGKKYLFGGTFPGLTVGKILQNYPAAPELWPSTPVPISFDESEQPVC
ncbi:hypothetical protein [Mucilaginibacter sp. FT3.2]|uniref:hypothetical protein n=1 Tax=Mucilaginibacter sp. FT3.2 TaxID=2723090 RepID=UPI00161D7C40|nr:hypothetical protein [Mucilaginibacter sp. FT3.2]MBB6230306.1 hypothetical protein [Mucilaginibacter sp. FT3.2]